jgi:hypothetical protein
MSSSKLGETPNCSIATGDSVVKFPLFVGSKVCVSVYRESTQVDSRLPFQSAAAADPDHPLEAMGESYYALLTHREELLS